ncbi:MAG: hypothetical protein Q8M31_07590 [Beijerinckiaceae bacterium]|nr:hypothetical protein [Beijerinckiaceae bacterium]
MEHKSAHELRAVAEVSPTPPLPLDRNGRLNRWAEILERDPDRRVNLVHELEFATRAAQAQMRANDSALSLAYADPLFRSLGLNGDRVGDGQTFFGLSDSQTHRLLCSCLHGEAMRAGDAARLVRKIATPLPGVIVRGAIATALCAVPVMIYYLG